MNCELCPVNCELCSVNCNIPYLIYYILYINNFTNILHNTILFQSNFQFLDPRGESSEKVNSEKGERIKELKKSL